MGKVMQMSDPFIARHGDSVVPHRRGPRNVIMNKDTPMGKKTDRQNSSPILYPPFLYIQFEICYVEPFFLL